MSIAERSSQSNKRKKTMSCSEITTRKSSEITTREIFKANFPSISVPGDEICELNPEIWNFEGSENVIFQWLQATSVTIVSTSKLIDKKNEHCSR